MSNTVINSDPEIMGGTPVFMGTRVPVSILTDYLVEGYGLNYFLYQYPSVGREQAVEVIKQAIGNLTGEPDPDATHDEQADQLLGLVQGR